MSDDGIQGCTITRIHSEFISEEGIEQLKKWRDKQTQVDRDNWHIHFILQSYLISTRSLDAETQFGCVLTKDNRIIGSGYNSFIRGIRDTALPNLRPDKYPFMIHAEHNAILNCAMEGVSTKDARLYVNGRPCVSCLQFIYQAGIKDIYYSNAVKAKMNSQESDLTFEILAYLMPKINIYCIDLDKTTLEKIDKIRSCR